MGQMQRDKRILREAEGKARPRVMNRIWKGVADRAQRASEALQKVVIASKDVAATLIRIEEGE